MLGNGRCWRRQKQLRGLILALGFSLAGCAQSGEPAPGGAPLAPPQPSPAVSPATGATEVTAAQMAQGMQQAQVAAAAEQAAVPPHLRDALELVREIGPRSNLYAHQGTKVIFPGIKGGPLCHADCSGFLNILLKHSYGFMPEDLKVWFGVPRPLAKTWYAVILGQRGFQRIDTIQGIQPGDFLAVKYPAASENTGHCMLAAGTAQSVTPAEPQVEGTVQWTLEVIDSSHTTHGPTDTRHLALKPPPPPDPNAPAPPDDRLMQRDTLVEPVPLPTDGKPHDSTGVGKGTIRLYTDKTGKIVGYCWSTQATAKYKNATEFAITAGRLVKDFKPADAPKLEGIEIPTEQD